MTLGGAVKSASLSYNGSIRIGMPISRGELLSVMSTAIPVTALLLGCCFAAVTAAAQIPLGPSDIANRLLAAHNGERAKVGVPPLQWDANLAVAAASYGPALASLGRLQHSPRANRPGQRENLWRGTRGAFSPEQMVANWVEEKAYFQAGLFPYVSSTGNWSDVAHYTQIIWRSTTRVGCATHASGNTEYLICRYSPPGNTDGKPVP